MKSKHGGQRNPQESRYDLIPFEGLEAVGKIFALGEARYGRHPENPFVPNWTGLDLTTDQSPLSHAVRHIYAYASGDESEDNLAAATANLFMLLWFRDNPSSRYFGLRYPEIQGGGEHQEEDDDSGDLDLPEPYPGCRAQALANASNQGAGNYVRNVLRSFGFPIPPDDDQERQTGA